MLIKSLALASVAAVVVLGPPRIAVRTSDLPAGAVAIATAEYHTDHGDARVYGTIHTVEAGKRVEREVALHKLDNTHYRVDHTWGAMPVVLVLGVEQGEHGKLGVAEALVRVDRNGRALAVEVGRTKPLIGNPMPRGLKPSEIDDALVALGYRLGE